MASTSEDTGDGAEWVLDDFPDPDTGRILRRDPATGLVYEAAEAGRWPQVVGVTEGDSGEFRRIERQSAGDGGLFAALDSYLKAHRVRFMDFFNECDVERSGRLDARGVRRLASLVQPGSCEGQLLYYQALLDAGGRGGISYPELLEVAKQCFTAQRDAAAAAAADAAAGAALDRLRAHLAHHSASAYKHFREEDTPGSGGLSYPQLSALLRRLLPDLSDVQRRGVLAYFYAQDIARSGCTSWAAVARVMRLPQLAGMAPGEAEAGGAPRGASGDDAAGEAAEEEAEREAAEEAGTGEAEGIAAEAADEEGAEREAAEVAGRVTAHGTAWEAAEAHEAGETGSEAEVASAGGEERVPAQEAAGESGYGAKVSAGRVGVSEETAAAVPGVAAAALNYFTGTSHGVPPRAASAPKGQEPCSRATSTAQGQLTSDQEDAPRSEARSGHAAHSAKGRLEEVRWRGEALLLDRTAHPVYRVDRAGGWPRLVGVYRDGAVVMQDRVLASALFGSLAAYTRLHGMELREVFSRFDQRGRGWLGPGEAGRLVAHFLPGAGLADVGCLQAVVDARGGITYPEFLELARKYSAEERAARALEPPSRQQADMSEALVRSNLRRIAPLPPPPHHLPDHLRLNLHDPGIYNPASGAARGTTVPHATSYGGNHHSKALLAAGGYRNQPQPALRGGSHQGPRHPQQHGSHQPVQDMVKAYGSQRPSTASYERQRPVSCGSHRKGPSSGAIPQQQHGRRLLPYDIHDLYDLYRPVLKMYGTQPALPSYSQEVEMYCKQQTALYGKNTNNTGAASGCDSNQATVGSAPVPGDSTEPPLEQGAVEPVFPKPPSARRKAKGQYRATR